MKKIKYIIVEDDIRHIEALQKAIKTTLYEADIYMSDILECAQVCTDGLQAWAILQQRTDIELVFLDNDMPKMTGESLLEILKIQQNPPKVILVSQFAEPMADLVTFNKIVAAPIFKPATSKRLKAAMDRVLPLLIQAEKTFIAIADATIKHKRVERFLDTEDIACIESLTKTVYVHYMNQAIKCYEKLVSNSDYHTLSDLMNELPAKDFFRPNNATIVNRKHILGVAPTQVYLKHDGREGIGISPNCRTAFQTWYYQK